MEADEDRHAAASALGYHRVLKPARTVVVLAGADKIAPAHLAKALHSCRG